MLLGKPHRRNASYGSLRFTPVADTTQTFGTTRIEGIRATARLSSSRDDWSSGIEEDDARSTRQLFFQAAGTCKPIPH